MENNNEVSNIISINRKRKQGSADNDSNFGERQVQASFTEKILFIIEKIFHYHERYYTLHD